MNILTIAMDFILTIYQNNIEVELTLPFLLKIHKIYHLCLQIKQSLMDL